MSLSLNTLAFPSTPVDAATDSDKSTKIHKASQQFESLLIGEMLKSAREEGSEGWLGSGGSTGDDSAMGMAESQLANALSQNGGLGLSKEIERSLLRVTSQNIARTTDSRPAPKSAEVPLSPDGAASRPVLASQNIAETPAQAYSLTSSAKNP